MCEYEVGVKVLETRNIYDKKEEINERYKMGRKQNA